MIIKPDENGNYYLARRTTKKRALGDQNTKSSKTEKLKQYRDWYMVKCSERLGIVELGKLTIIYFPEIYIGKRVRFRVEIMEDKH